MKSRSLRRRVAAYIRRLCAFSFLMVALGVRWDIEPVQAAAIAIGETTILPNVDGGNADLLIAQQATLSQAATIQSLSFYVETASGGLRLGLYDASGPSGGPGTKKAETNEIIPTTGWNTANVITPTSLPAGTYWLAYLSNSNALTFRNTFTGATHFYSFTYGPMPAVFSTATNYGGVHWSFYATLNTGDATPPTVSLTAPAANAIVAGTATTVSATASDDVGVAGVQFLLDGVNLNAEDTIAPYSTSWNTTTASNGSHVLSARARDAAGNTATATNVNVTVDNQAPTGSVVINGGAAATNNAAVNLTLSATDAHSAVSQMQFSNDGTSYSAPEPYATSKTWTLAAGEGSKTVYVQYKDGAGNWSAAFTDTIVYDVTAPIISAQGVSSTTSNSATLTWSTNEAATSQIEYGTTTAYGQVTTIDAALVTAHSVVVTGLAPQTTYNFRARSNDAATNEGVGPNSTFTTQASSDTTPPTTPTGVTATAVSPTQINLTWNASTDNIGVANYVVRRNGVVVGSPTTTSFSDTGLTRATTFTYTVSATDAAGNASAPSTAVNATTPALVISNVQASSITSTGAVITWTTDIPSTSRVDYGTTTAYGSATEDLTLVVSHSRSLAGLTPNTLYHYRVMSADTSNNQVMSNDAVFTTQPGSQSGVFQNEILIASGLDKATSIEFLPNNDMLILELRGRIVRVPAGTMQIDPSPFLQLTNVGNFATAEDGLMDMVLDPNFATNRFYYVFYTLGTPNRDRVSRFTANASLTGTVAGSEFVVYQDPLDSGTGHHGGALNFGPDGKLYIATGEHFNPAFAQNLNFPKGKILRVNADGTIPTDNPFYDGAGPNDDSIWALGLRNPYRAYIDPVTGRFYFGDVGGNDPATAIEEINVGVRGANYGWPSCEGTCSNPAFTNPIHAWPHGGRDAAATGGFVYHGSQFPAQYQGNYFFADYTQNWIRRLTFDANGNVTGVFNFEPPNGALDGPYGDIVALSEGPDGALYYVDIGYSDVGGNRDGLSKIRRIRFVSNNLPPTAVASADKTSGPPPLTVNFSSAGSSDPEGAVLTYLWDFGDGVTSTQANPVHVYNQAGPYQVRLSVSDGVNTTLATPLTIRVGNAPSATILTPANGALFRAGNVIGFSGDATDVEDGALPATAFAWSVDFLHEGHVHPGLSQSGVKAGSFTIGTSGHDFSGNTRYRILLTVTDSSGLQSSQTVIIYPDKVNLTFDTVPSGLTISLDGLPHVTPFVYDTLIGFNHTIIAANQSQGSTNYVFQSWSDGGAQQHTIVVPATSQSYVATFATGPSPLPPGLVAGYSMNAGSGTLVSDVTGANNGTMSGAGVTWTTQGKYGNALSFNGVSGNVTIPHSAGISLSSSFTISAWIKPAVLAGAQTVLIKEVTGGCGYWIQTGGNQISSGFNAGGICREHYTSLANLNPGTWYYISVVFDDVANTYKIYVNGVEVLSDAETAAILPNSEALVIGQTGYAPGNYERWNGVIDEVRIYNRALPPSEIQRDMNTPLP